MLSSPFQRFYSKLLLFGEYAIINGAVGLAIPFDRFYMDFTYAKDQFTIRKSTALLERYLGYVKAHCTAENYDIEGFEADISKGLCVSSTIPIGYGLGSSGALVANFFHTYCHNKENFNNINDLKKELGLLESFFHGASSGLDPLVSYLSTGVLIEKENECSRIEIPAKNANDFGLFIINSKIERRTAPLVEIFKEKLKTNSEFSDVVHSKLIPLNNEIIQCYIQNDAETGILKIKELSRLQYKNFKEMIPPAIDQLWKQGLDSGAYTMKLCGAGGGGFFLGFGNAEQIHDYEIIRFG